MTAQMILKEGLWRVQTVDAGYGGDDDAIGARNERGDGCETFLLNPLVDAEFLVNVQVPLGEIGLGLIVVIVRNEIFHGVVGKIAHHFLMQLASKGLVVAHDEGGNVELLNDVGHGEGLTAPRHAEQHTSFLSIFQLRN